MSERYLLGPGLVDKLRDTVRTVDGMKNPPEPPTRLTFDEPARAPRQVKIGDYNGTVWSKDETKTVTLRNVGITGLTVSAINLFQAIPSATTTSTPCAVARDGTAWYVVAPSPGGGAKACTFTGQWNIDSTKTVTAIATGETINVTNILFTVPNPEGTSKCVIVQEGSTWLLANVRHRSTTLLTRVAIEGNTFVFNRSSVEIVGETISPTSFPLTTCETYSGSTVTNSTSSGNAASNNSFSFFLG